MLFNLWVGFFNLYIHWGICLLITNLLSRRHLEGRGLLGRRLGDLGELLHDVVQLAGRLLLSRRHLGGRGVLLGQRFHGSRDCSNNYLYYPLSC